MTTKHFRVGGIGVLSATRDGHRIHSLGKGKERVEILLQPPGAVSA